MASSLSQAAGQAFDNLFVKWSVGQLKISMSFFWPQVMAIFPDSQANGRPVANWGTVLASAENQTPNGKPIMTYLNNAAQIVYRLCWMGSYLQSVALITNAQANDLLAAYNGSFT